MPLTGKQRRHLRALGHALEPVAYIGKEGVSAAFVKAVEQALLDHELIKVKVGGNADLPRHEAAALLAERTASEIAQVLGNTILLYRARPDDPSIVLP